MTPTTPRASSGMKSMPWWRRLFTPSDPWEYGTSDGGFPARRHRRSGHIEFELWPAGHYRGYPDRPFWCRIGAGHTFIPKASR